MKKILKFFNSLFRPQVTLKLLCKSHEDGELEETLEAVRERNLPRLLGYVRQWNTKTRLTEVVQSTQKFLLTRHVLRLLDDEDARMEGMEGMRAFNEKHLARISALSDRLSVVDALLETK